MVRFGGLRKEKSKFSSGEILNINLIPELKETHYVTSDIALDGDAPKQFIKAYFYERDGLVRKDRMSSWCSYIAKTAEKYYPHESVYEYLINRIGQEIGMRMNQIRLVRINSQIRFLSKYFLKKGEELIHGAEICGEHLGDIELADQIANDKKTARELFTFEFIKDSIRNVFPECFSEILGELVKMICYDAIVGNNDRHFYNWGVIRTPLKSSKRPTFAPLYDSARGLFWNSTEQQISENLRYYESNGKKIANYIQNASPRISIAENVKANHFELVNYLICLDDNYFQIAKSLCSDENEQKVLKMIKVEFSKILSIDRIKIISLLLNLRFNNLRRLIHDKENQKLV